MCSSFYFCFLISFPPCVLQSRRLGGRIRLKTRRRRSWVTRCGVWELCRNRNSTRYFLRTCSGLCQSREPLLCVIGSVVDPVKPGEDHPERGAGQRLCSSETEGSLSAGPQPQHRSVSETLTSVKWNRWNSLTKCPRVQSTAPLLLF